MTSAPGAEPGVRQRQLTLTEASKISYDLYLSERKSLEISVYPDGSVVVKAPKAVAQADIEEKIRKRARWIQKQLRYFARFEPRMPPRQFVGGESHLYLGRSYRLKITISDSDQVLLKGRFFHIRATDANTEHIAGLLQGWYLDKAAYHFAKVFDDCWSGFQKHGAPRPTLRIAHMKNRWGSMSRNATLTLNPDLIRTPRACIEYVVIHELCHLLHYNHGPEFKRLLKRSLPDWVYRKHKLEMALFRQI